MRVLIVCKICKTKKEDTNIGVPPFRSLRGVLRGNLFSKKFVWVQFYAMTQSFGVDGIKVYNRTGRQAYRPKTTLYCHVLLLLFY